MVFYSVSGVVGAYGRDILESQLDDAKYSSLCIFWNKLCYVTPRGRSETCK